MNNDNNYTTGNVFLAGVLSENNFIRKTDTEEGKNDFSDYDSLSDDGSV